MELVRNSCTPVISAGSSQKPTVNAAVEKVQTGGFGDPNGLTGTGKQGAKLYAAQAGGFDMPVGAGQGNGSGGAKGIKGTVASADFGNGIATGGNGDGRSNGKGSGVATGGFGSEQVVHRRSEDCASGFRPGNALRWKSRSSRIRFTPMKHAA